MVKKYLLLGILFILLFSVGCNETNNNGNVVDNNDTTGTDTGIIDQEAINNVISSFSSPVEMAALMKDLNVVYSKKYLVNTDVADNYDTNFKKSIGLGVLSADLGYLNVYGRTNQIVEYLTVIKRIADDLRVGQFFDFQTLKRLAVNNENIDSLLYLSTHSFHQMDEHLRNNKRSNLSALVVTGVWLEGLYLITQVYKEKPTQELEERIGEQKVILNQILPILKIWQSDKQFESLVTDLDELKEVYEDVKITYEVGETKVITNPDGTKTVVQEDKSVVVITPDQVKRITDKTEKIRNKVTGVAQ